MCVYVFIKVYEGRKKWKELLGTGGGLRTLGQANIGRLKSPKTMIWRKRETTLRIFDTAEEF